MQKFKTLKKIVEAICTQIVFNASHPYLLSTMFVDFILILFTSYLAPSTDVQIRIWREESGRQAGWHHFLVEDQVSIQLQNCNVIVERSLVKVALVVDPANHLPKHCLL